MDFGSVTGYNPLSLGKKERVARDLGFTADQAVALQKVAYDELSARAGYTPLKTFEAKVNKE